MTVPDMSVPEVSDLEAREWLTQLLDHRETLGKQYLQAQVRSALAETGDYEEAVFEGVKRQLALLARTRSILIGTMGSVVGPPADEVEDQFLEIMSRLYPKTK